MWANENTTSSLMRRVNKGHAGRNGRKGIWIFVKILNCSSNSVHLPPLAPKHTLLPYRLFLSLGSCVLGSIKHYLLSDEITCKVARETFPVWWPCSLAMLLLGHWEMFRNHNQWHLMVIAFELHGSCIKKKTQPNKKTEQQTQTKQNTAEE